MKPLLSTLERVRQSAIARRWGSRPAGWVWAVALVLHLLALVVVQDVTLFHSPFPESAHFDLVGMEFVEPRPMPKNEGGGEREVTIPVSALPIIGSTKVTEKLPEPNVSPSWDPMTVRAPNKLDPGSESVQVLGMNARLERVLFLVDVSGSMWNQVGGVRVFEYARAEVARSVSLLPAGKEFNVLYYSDTTVALFQEPAEATPENKERARVFLQRLPDLSGATDFFKMLKTVFAMRPDGIFLFTDGITQVAPWRVSQQFRVLHETLCPNSKVYVVSFSPENEREQNGLLSQLCESTGGSFRRYPLPSPPVVTPSVPKKSKK